MGNETKSHWRPSYSQPRLLASLVNRRVKGKGSQLKVLERCLGVSISSGFDDPLVWATVQEVYTLARPNAGDLTDKEVGISAPVPMTMTEADLDTVVHEAGQYMKDKGFPPKWWFESLYMKEEDREAYRVHHGLVADPAPSIGVEPAPAEQSVDPFAVDFDVGDWGDSAGEMNWRDYSAGIKAITFEPDMIVNPLTPEQRKERDKALRRSKRLQARPKAKPTSKRVLNVQPSRVRQKARRKTKQVRQRNPKSVVQSDYDSDSAQSLSEALDESEREPGVPDWEDDEEFSS